MSYLRIKVYTVNPETGERSLIRTREWNEDAVTDPLFTTRWPPCECVRCWPDKPPRNAG